MKKLIIGLLVLLLSLSLMFDNILVKLLPFMIFSVIFIREGIISGIGMQHLFREFGYLLFMVLLIAIAVFRNGRDDVSLGYTLLKIATFLSFALALFAVVFKYRFKVDMLKLFIYIVLLPILIYVSINLSLFIIGFREEVYSGKAVLLSYLGYGIDRVKFVFSNGINGYGALLGVLLNLSLIGFFLIKRLRNVFLLGLFFSFASLLLTDSRGPLIFSLLIFLFFKYYLKRFNRPKFLWLIPILPLMGPFLLLSVLTLVSDSSLSEYFARSSQDFTSGNSRLPIWLMAVSDFSNFNGLSHIFGYGEFGHYTAGLSQVYGTEVFQHVEEGAEYMHPHNSYLSIALDYGYLGLLFFILLQYKILSRVKKYWNQHRDICYLVLGNLLYFNLVGIAETMFGFYYQNINYVFFMVNVFIFSLGGIVETNRIIRKI